VFLRISRVVPMRLLAGRTIFAKGKVIIHQLQYLFVSMEGMQPEMFGGVSPTISYDGVGEATIR